MARKGGSFPRLLFADNEAAIREFCRRELEQAGYDVLLAVDGEDAVEILRQTRVDAVVLDQHMPRCSGLEAARWIKQHWPTLPVVLFSADEHFADQHFAPVDGCVTKSENLDRLHKKLQELLSRPMPQLSIPALHSSSSSLLP